MKAIYIDLETTGLDCKISGITQLSAIIEIDGKVVDEFDMRVKPFDDAVIEDEALKVQQKTLAEIMSGVDECIVFNDFLKLLDAYIDKYNPHDKFIVVGYNIRFDIGFLYELFLRHNNPFLFSYFNSNFLDIPSLLGYLELEHYDTIKQFKENRKAKNNKLETWADAFDIQLTAHDSFEDIKATYKLFKKIKKLLKSGVDNNHEDYN